MPKKNAEELLFERRRQALISAIADSKLTKKEIAALVKPDDPAEQKKFQFTLGSFVRSEKFRRLSLAEATLLAPHLGVELRRLTTGELTEAEKQAHGGESNSTETVDPALARRERGQLAKKRLSAIKKALKSKGALWLFVKLEDNKKTWTLHQVRSFLGGGTFPRKAFCVDVAQVLQIPSETLFIQEHPADNVVERKAKKQRRVVADSSIPIEQTGNGLTVVISCPLFGQITDEIKFDAESRQFTGVASRIVKVGSEFRFEVSLPIPESGIPALLGLVTG